MPGSQPPHLVFATYRRFCAAINTTMPTGDGRDGLDPTRHAEVYAAMRDRVVPHLQGRGPVHVNVSPGTPAMHAVWIIVHAGAAFPPDTRLWSSQYNPATKRTRIDPVQFPVTTWLSEVHEVGHVKPDLAVYEPQARSLARLAAFERLARYARVGDPRAAEERHVAVFVRFEQLLQDVRSTLHELHVCLVLVRFHFALLHAPLWSRITLVRTR